MSLTLEVLLCLPVTYLASLLCIISILFTSSAKYGSPTEQAYSSDGLAKDLYACSFTEAEMMFEFLFRKLSVLFAFLHMLLMCVLHLRSDWMVTSRYFALVACSSTWPCKL